jgi:hypothetical protein
MRNPYEPPAIVTARTDALTETDDSTEIKTIMAQVDLVTADPASINQYEDPAPEVQLAAIAKSIDLYWKLKNPCEAATIEYLCQRPHEILRFRDLQDGVKAKVITRSPKLIYDWLKRGHLSAPVEPDGFHDAVMREILTRIARGLYSRTIMPTLNRMREIGYDWPEFEAIEKSFSAE